MSGPGVAMKPARELAQVERLDACDGDARPDAAVRFPSAGQRAFAKLHEKTLYVAAVLGLSQPFVSQLQNGRRRPDLDTTIAIEEHFDIRASLWKPDAPSPPLTSAERSRCWRETQRERKAIASPSTADATEGKRKT